MIAYKEDGRFTMVNAVAHTGMLIEERPTGAIDVRMGEVPANKFGVYAP